VPDPDHGAIDSTAADEVVVNLQQWDADPTDIAEQTTPVSYERSTRRSMATGLGPQVAEWTMIAVIRRPTGWSVMR
jgi:hypothetical protein